MKKLLIPLQHSFQNQTDLMSFCLNNWNKGLSSSVLFPCWKTQIRYSDKLILPLSSKYISGGILYIWTYSLNVNNENKERNAEKCLDADLHIANCRNEIFYQQLYLHQIVLSDRWYNILCNPLCTFTHQWW